MSFIQKGNFIQGLVNWKNFLHSFTSISLPFSKGASHKNCYTEKCSNSKQKMNLRRKKKKIEENQICRHTLPSAQHKWQRKFNSSTKFFIFTQNAHHISSY